jgi:RNA polymerase sigma-70 factor (ECF subfamily)
LWTDGGGVVRAARRVIVGARKVSRFLVAVTPTLPATVHVRTALVNGQPGLVAVDGPTPVLAAALEIIDGRITGVRMVTNPEKLERAHIR